MRYAEPNAGRFLENLRNPRIPLDCRKFRHCNQSTEQAGPAYDGGLVDWLLISARFSFCLPAAVAADLLVRHQRRIVFPSPITETVNHALDDAKCLHFSTSIASRLPRCLDFLCHPLRHGCRTSRCITTGGPRCIIAHVNRPFWPPESDRRGSPDTKTATPAPTKPPSETGSTETQHGPRARQSMPSLAKGGDTPP